MRLVPNVTRGASVMLKSRSAYGQVRLDKANSVKTQGEDKKESRMGKVVVPKLCGRNLLLHVVCPDTDIESVLWQLLRGKDEHFFFWRLCFCLLLFFLLVSVQTSRDPNDCSERCSSSSSSPFRAKGHARTHACGCLAENRPTHMWHMCMHERA